MPVLVSTTCGVVVEKTNRRTHQTVEDSVVQIDGRIDAHGEEGGRPDHHGHELSHYETTIHRYVLPLVHAALAAVLRVAPVGVHRSVFDH